MKLVDRADGVRGHFCIGRRAVTALGDFWEFYNKGAWVSAGQLFTTRENAEFVLSQLRKSGAPEDVER